jgi:hypothetical protein
MDQRDLTSCAEEAVLPELVRTYFDAVRNDDVAGVRGLLQREPGLVHARWPGRGRPDGLIRSLGPPPYNQHTWRACPVNPDDPNDPRYTSTPLIWTRDDEMVRLLVEHGAEVNARGSSGDLELLDWILTPLWRAAHDGRLESVRLLVERGADVNFRSPDGCNQALKTAVELNSFRAPEPPHTEAHDQVTDLLLTHGAVPDLAHAASLGRLERVRQMSEADADCMTRLRPAPELLTGGAAFERPLPAAERRRRVDVATYLRHHGAV